MAIDPTPYYEDIPGRAVAANPFDDRADQPEAVVGIFEAGCGVDHRRFGQCLA